MMMEWRSAYLQLHGKDGTGDKTTEEVTHG